MNCLIVANLFKSETEKLCNSVIDFLQSFNVNVEKFSYNGNKPDSCDFNQSFNGFDFVITLGGDGTVLYACRNCAPLSIPVFSINLGEFGFLAPVKKDDWKKSLEQFIKGEATVSSRSMLECEVIRSGVSVFKNNCMNDCFISSIISSRIINLNVAYNHATLGPFKASGIIISSPTGSTAHSAAAGGPIVDPNLSAFVLTTLSSFSLSARPLVFGSSGEFIVTVLPCRYEVSLMCDGQISFPLEKDDVVIISIPEYKAKLIGATQEKFYSALQSKLNWAGGPRA